MHISKLHFLGAGLSVLCALSTDAKASDTLSTTAVDTVAVEALAEWATHNSIRIESNTTDWKVSATVSDDNTCPADPAYSPAWTHVDFDDSQWLGAHQRYLDQAPHFGVDPVLGTDYIWHPPEGGYPLVSYFRTEFNLDALPVEAEASLVVDDNYQLYVNGVLIDDNHSDGAYHTGPFDIRGWLQVGKNVIAIKGWDGPGSCTPRDWIGKCVAFLAIIETEPTKIPLGRMVSGNGNGGYFKVYVPDRLGGKLQVSSTGGQIELYYPNTDTKVADAAAEFSYSVGEGDHGWYYLKRTGSGPYTISNEFSQDGFANKKPWNFWYWPILPQSDIDMNLYGSPTAKYDVSIR